MMIKSEPGLRMNPWAHSSKTAAEIAWQKFIRLCLSIARDGGAAPAKYLIALP